MLALLFVLLMALFAHGFAAPLLWVPAGLLLFLLLRRVNRLSRSWGQRQPPDRRRPPQLPTTPQGRDPP